MLERLRKLLMVDLSPYIELGVEFTTGIFGSFRHELMLRNFSAQEAQEIILSILDFPKRLKR